MRTPPLGFAVVTGAFRDWREVERGGYTLVRITVGTPRFIPHAKQLPHVPELAPYGRLFDLGGDEFDRAYGERLDAIGPDRIRERLMAVRGAYGESLCLCCFENVVAG